MTDVEQAATETDTDSSDERGWIAASVGAKGYRADVQVRHHRLVVDEPTSSGGTDDGPTPYEYLLTALATCTAMTLRVYADRKQWPLEGIVVRMRSAQNHLSDCVQCADAPVGVTWVDRRIEMSGPLTDEQRRRMLEIADRCPVKQSLERGIRIRPPA